MDTFLRKFALLCFRIKTRKIFRSPVVRSFSAFDHLELSCRLVVLFQLVLEHRPEEDAAVDIILILYFFCAKNAISENLSSYIQFSIKRTGTRFGDPQILLTDDKKNCMNPL